MKRKQEISIEKRIGSIPPVKIPPEDLELMRQRITRDFKRVSAAMRRSGISMAELEKNRFRVIDGQIKILQMPQDPPELHACDKFNAACAKQNCHHEQKGGG